MLLAVFYIYKVAGKYIEMSYFGAVGRLRKAISSKKLKTENEALKHQIRELQDEIIALEAKIETYEQRERERCNLPYHSLQERCSHLFDELQKAEKRIHQYETGMVNFPVKRIDDHKRPA